MKMKMKKLLGYEILSLPFILIGVGTYLSVGLFGLLMTVGGVALFVGSVWLGVGLIMGEI